MSTKKEINSTKKLNKLLTNSDISVYKTRKYWEIFRSFGYIGGEQDDRILKLSAQLEACEMLGFNIDYQTDRCVSKITNQVTMNASGWPIYDPGPSLNPPMGTAFKGKVVCDVGCGTAPVSLIFAGMGAKVHAVTKYPQSHNDQHAGVIENSQIFLETGVDYIKHSKENFEDSSIDLFLDGCAITHFIHPPTEEYCPSDACYFTGKEIARTMKDDGYLIVTSDVSLFEDGTMINLEKFVSMRKMIESFEAAGLKLFGDVLLLPKIKNGPCPVELLESLDIIFDLKGYAVARMVFVKK